MDLLSFITRLSFNNEAIFVWIVSEVLMMQAGLLGLLVDHVDETREMPWPLHSGLTELCLSRRT